MNLRGVTEIHDKLNPRLWQDLNLDPEIREHLLQIADAFLAFVKIPVRPEDIILTGSAANYNYSAKYSDIDLHIVMDLSDPVVKELFDAKKQLWNKEHKIDLDGMPVEIYAQDKREPHISSGVYSVQNNRWVQKPDPAKESLPPAELVIKKVDYMRGLIDQAVDENNADALQRAKDKIKQFRQAGLDHGGEFSAENLAFKVLRRDGSIERLIDLKRQKEDAELSA